VYFSITYGRGYRRDVALPDMIDVLSGDNHVSTIPRLIAGRPGTITALLGRRMGTCKLDKR